MGSCVRLKTHRNTQEPVTRRALVLLTLSFLAKEVHMPFEELVRQKISKRGDLVLHQCEASITDGGDGLCHTVRVVLFSPHIDFPLIGEATDHPGTSVHEVVERAVFYCCG